MNPVVSTIPISPRSSRAASPARERHDDTGFDLALGAAAAAHAPRRAEAPPEPRDREAARPQREEAPAPARPTASQDNRGNEQDAGLRETAPAGSVARDGARVAKELAREPAHDGADARTTMASDATSAAGTKAQNASAPPPVAGRGQDQAPSPTATAAGAVALPLVPALATLPFLRPAGVTGSAMPDMTPATPTPTPTTPQAPAVDMRQPAAMIVAGAGDLAVRVLSVKEAPRSGQGQVAAVLAPADIVSQANTLRAAEPPGEPAPLPVPATLKTQMSEPAAEPAPAKQAPPASAAIPAPTVRGDGANSGGGQGDGATRRQREGAALADTGEGTGTTSVAVNADSSRSTKPGEPVVTRGNMTTVATQTVEDPRLEPMRRAADQVTLKFDGEDGLEGRLRITVRGDSVRASILSSHEGTLERLGGELGTLRRALNEQGFTTTRVAVHDMRATEANGTSDTRQTARDGEERRQGEPQRRSGQGRESRQGSGSEQGRRGPQEERRTE